MLFIFFFSLTCLLWVPGSPQQNNLNQVIVNRDLEVLGEFGKRKPTSQIILNITQFNINLWTIDSWLPRQYFDNEYIWNVCLVVKGDAYGHGIEEIVYHAFQEGFRNFCIVDSWEAKIIRDLLGTEVRIVRIRSATHGEYLLSAKYDMEDIVGSLEQIYALVNASIETQTIRPAYVSIDTNMGRTGFPFDQPEDVLPILEIFREFKNQIRLAGFMTHISFSTPEDWRKWSSEFLNTVCPLVQNGSLSEFGPLIIHWTNSAGSEQLGLGNIPPELEYCLGDPRVTFMARPGSALYRTDLMSWITKVANIEHLAAGDLVGYSGVVLTRDSDIIVVPIGYADGYPKFPYGDVNFTSQVQIHGQRFPMLSITMNMAMIDVTDSTTTIHVDNDVLLFGSNPGDITVSELCSWFGLNEFGFQLNVGMYRTSLTSSDLNCYRLGGKACLNNNIAPLNDCGKLLRPEETAGISIGVGIVLFVMGAVCVYYWVRRPKEGEKEALVPKDPLRF